MTSPSKDWVGLQNDQDFWKKNAKLNRPMSPHLTIYKFPLPAVLSVMHRGTGVALSLGISGAALTLLAGGHDLSFYINFVQVFVCFVCSKTKSLGIPSPLIFLGKSVLVFPFAYHTANGVRHLVTDNQYLLLRVGLGYRPQPGQC